MAIETTIRASTEWRTHNLFIKGNHEIFDTHPYLGFYIFQIANRTNLSPVRPILPAVPIEIPTVVLPLPTPPPPPISSVAKPLSPLPRETQQQQPPVTISDSEPVKQRVTTPIPIRQYSEAATQTLQVRSNLHYK